MRVSADSRKNRVAKARREKKLSVANKKTNMNEERDYVLGTNLQEVERLGLQHRAWRSVVLSFWKQAGLGAGSKVLDLGAGPGYATVDLAEIVGPTGQVTAVERSANFVRVLQETCAQSGLANVNAHELDLMTEALPATNQDFTWCRWVASFVSDPDLLIRKIAGSLRPGGCALFHEYGHYRTWQLSPPLPSQEKLVEQIIESWSATGGKTDVGLDLPPLLDAHGLKVRSIVPRVFCLRPNEQMWQWMASFIESAPRRLQELGRIDQIFVDRLRSDFAAVEANPSSMMMTPLVLEIVAAKEA